jgi:polyisoprenyl-teichoic acid--peptidoglycan teichoic acid transferase
VFVSRCRLCLTPKPPIITEDVGAGQLSCIAGAELVRIDSGHFVTLFLTNDAEPANRDTHTADAQRKRRSRLAVGLSAVALLIVGALIAGVLYAVSIDRAANENLRRHSGLLPAETPTELEDARPAKGSGTAANYVLMGSDSRDVGNAGHGRSDVLMVMHLAADRKSAYMISFPRDMYVPIPGHGKNKINAAFAFGGPALTVRTLEGLLDTRMDHVALIDFEGFINLTEELGGVTVYNKHSSLTGGYKFPVGNVNLRGEQALAYVRERKQLPNGDLDRAERQRIVLRAILAKGLAKETISNPFKFVSFVRGVSAHVSVDEGLTEGKLRKTALSLRLSPDDVHLLQAPISGFGTTPTGQSIDIVDKKKLAQLEKALRNDQMDSYIEKFPAG